MYDISKSTSPKMPELKNGTEIIKFLSLETRKLSLLCHFRHLSLIYEA